MEKEWIGVIIFSIILIFSFSVKADNVCPQQTAACIYPELCDGSIRCSPDYNCSFEDTECAFCADGYQGIPPNCHICGQNGIEPGEDCEGNNLNDETCQRLGFAEGTLSCNNCKFDTSGCTDHYVFVTQNTYTSDLRQGIVNVPNYLRGIAGAHQICRTEASNAGLEGWWKAWISINDWFQAKGFLKHYTTSYKCINGNVIANSWSDLTDESLDNPINCGPSGNTVSAKYVFTNTGADGSFIWGREADVNCPVLDGVRSCDCRDFTYAHDVSDGSAEVFKGYTTRSNSEWTNYLYLACSSRESAKARLYCFQQEFDGDADEIDCTTNYGNNNVGIWLYHGEHCGLSEGCDTFHDWQGYWGEFCCGDDEREYYLIDNIARGGYTNACCIENIHTCIDEWGNCQTGLEGLNYEENGVETCEDSKDNDCDGSIDDEDDGCNPELILSSYNPDNICDNELKNYRVELRKLGGDLNWDSTIIYDEIYNSNGGLEHRETVSCEIDGPNYNNNICSKSYSLRLGEGNYYHNVYVREGVNEIKRKDNYNGFEVYGRLDLAHGCCIREGLQVVQDKPCCKDIGGGFIEEIPSDNNGKCGCEPPTQWIDMRCRYPAAQCYSPEAACNIDLRENFVRWLITPGCFMNFLGQSPGEPPYEYACCPISLNHDYDNNGENDIIWTMNPDDLFGCKIEVY